MNLKVDYLYYLEHQIRNPVADILELIFRGAKSIFDDAIKREIERRETIKRRLYNKKKIRHFDTLFMDEKDAYDYNKGRETFIKKDYTESGLRKAKEEKKKRNLEQIKRREEERKRAQEISKINIDKDNIITQMFLRDKFRQQQSRKKQIKKIKENGGYRMSKIDQLLFEQKTKLEINKYKEVSLKENNKEDRIIDREREQEIKKEVDKFRYGELKEDDKEEISSSSSSDSE